MTDYPKRDDVARKLLSGLDEALIVCGLGSPVSDTAGVKDRDLNFYVLGAMGSASQVGLGIALAQPDRSVLVITGDAELTMNIGALATIAVKKPRNLTIAVFDNERYGETGQQLSPTAFGLDIAGVALASGFPDATTIRSLDQVDALAQRVRQRSGLSLTVCKVSPGRSPIVMPPKDGVVLKTRFRRALLGVN
jgi:thiamine pyrophosphate-dependent acetolactate synthase large subunit-like protein